MGTGGCTSRPQSVHPWIRSRPSDPEVKNQSLTGVSSGRGGTAPGSYLISTSMLKDMLVVDADSHWCEPPDLFTKRAPAAFKDRVPRVEEVDGQKMWVFDGHPVSRASAGGVIARDGTKESSFRALMEWDHEM